MSSSNEPNKPNGLDKSFQWWMNWPAPQWPALSLAPQNLNQPINPGWNFGNMIINNTNSSAPAQELAMVSRHSYGRQLGRITDVLQVLLAERQGHGLDETVGLRTGSAKKPKRTAAETIEEFERMVQELDKARVQHAKDSADRLAKELAALKDADPAAWKRLMNNAG